PSGVCILMCTMSPPCRPISSSPEKRCGKTRNLQILGCLVRRLMHAANVTAAALMRAIDHYAPTLLIDEADTILPTAAARNCAAFSMRDCTAPRPLSFGVA